MYSLMFYVPQSHVEEVKTALFEAGAGRYDGYDCCSWETEGVGQFRPLQGSKPFIGTKDTLERVKEYRVEMICSNECIKDALKSLLKIHPYEQPAYSVTKILTENDLLK